MAWGTAVMMDAEASELLSRVQSGIREVNQAWVARLDDGLAYYRYVSSHEDEDGTRAAACEIAVAWRCTTGQPEPAARPPAPAPARAAQRAWTELVLDLPTLLGLSKDPGYLLGYGSLNCDQSRSLAGRSRWRVLVTIGEDAVAALLELFNAAHGRPVTAEDVAAALMNAVDHGNRLVLGEKDVGPAPPVKDPPTADGHGGWTQPPRGALKYKPGRNLARIIRMLDGTCRFTGCQKPAQDCEIDHLVPFNHADPMAGGWTIESNLACLCKEHHDLKTRGIIGVEMCKNRMYWIDTRAGQKTCTKPAVRSHARTEGRQAASQPRTRSG